MQAYQPDRFRELDPVEAGKRRRSQRFRRICRIVKRLLARARVEVIEPRSHSDGSG